MDLIYTTLNQTSEEAMSFIFDILLLIMSSEKVESRTKVKRYSRKVFKCLVVNMKKKDLEFNLWWMKKAVTVLSSMPMAFRYLAFFVKSINYLVSKILLPNLNDNDSLTDILSNLSLWTLSLELALNIRSRYFNLAFKAIYAKAIEKKDQGVIDLLLKNHSTVLAANKKVNINGYDILWQSLQIIYFVHKKFRGIAFNENNL